MNKASETIKIIGENQMNYFNEIVQQITSEVGWNSIKELQNSAKLLKREFKKLNEYYDELEIRIEQQNKENKQMSVSGLQKLSEIEQSKNLVKERMKKISDNLLIQLQTISLSFAKLSLESICYISQSISNYIQNTNEKLGGIITQKFLQFFAPEVDRLQQNIEANNQIFENTKNEVGEIKNFAVIIKKKKTKKSKRLSMSTTISDHEIPISHHLPMIHRICNEGKLDMLITLLDTSADNINMKDQNGNAPLHYATVKSHYSICKELLHRGFLLFYLLLFFISFLSNFIDIIIIF